MALPSTHIVCAWCFGAALAAPVTARGDAPCEAAAGAVPRSADDVRFTWVAQPLTVQAGDASLLSIQLQVPEGFEVFRDDIRLTVVDAAGLQVGEPLLPPGAPVRAPDGGPVMQRFEEQVQIRLPVTTADTEPGLRLLHLHGEVRGCSTRRCLGGIWEHLEVFVHVVGRDADAAPR